jgi:hypothetical protein
MARGEIARGGARSGGQARRRAWRAWCRRSARAAARPAERARPRGKRSVRLPTPDGQGVRHLRAASRRRGSSPTSTRRPREEAGTSWKGPSSARLQVKCARRGYAGLCRLAARLRNLPIVDHGQGYRASRA